jgi:type VI secretion system protein ImpA
MAPLDLTGWLAAVDDTAPSGPNLEFDSDFGALERAAQGEPERQAGDTLIPAKEPEWKAVEAQAAALMERTRDLRVLGHLAVARLHLSGLPAYADMLRLVHELLETRWDDVHPQLDPEDDNDPTLRATSLLRLADPALVLRYLRDMPLARSPRLGRFSWRDISVAIGAIKDDSRSEKPTEMQVRSAFQDTDPAYPMDLRAAAAAASEAAAAIPQSFDAKAGIGTGPNFADLSKLLSEITRFIDRFAVVPAAAGEADISEAADVDAGATLPTPAAGQRPSAVVSAATLTEISNRADALRLLDLACQYYRRYEPSSPLPLLIERAQRLAEKNFLEILRDLAPDGVMQAQNIVSGRDE